MKSQIVEHLPTVRTLLVVIDTGSFTEAARKLGITPSGVSKQLTRLEESLGVRLLERTTRSVRPTLAGLVLCQRVRPLFESFDDAAREARAETEQVAGRLRISAAPAFGRAVLMPVLRALGREHPGLRFFVTLTGRRVDFVEDEIDLAVREGALSDSSLVARPLCVARVGLYASPGYLEVRGAPRKLSEVARHDLVTVPVTAAGLGLDAESRDLARAARFLVDDLFAVAKLAEDSAGIAPLPDYVARERVARGVLLRVLPRTEIARVPIHAVYPSRRHLPRRVQVVVDALSKAVSAE